MTTRQLLDRLGYAFVNATAVAILFVSGVTYAELQYAETHARVVDGYRAR